MLAGVPLYKVWVVVSKRTATPLNATWAMTALAFFLGLPILFSPSTFLAMDPSPLPACTSVVSPFPSAIYLNKQLPAHWPGCPNASAVARWQTSMPCVPAHNTHSG